MEVLYPHCAGIDVHKDTVVACLLTLADWLASEGCTRVAKEATGMHLVKLLADLGYAVELTPLAS